VTIQKLRALSWVLAACAMSAAHAESLPDQITLSQGKYFCTWKNVPGAPPNPTPTPFCAEPAPRPRDVSDQMADWWGYLYRHDADAAVRLQDKFRAEWSAETDPSRKAAAASLSNSDLCSRFGRYHAEEDRAEIRKRKIVSQSEWPLVDAHRVRVGMSEVALLCSFGPPDSINRTVTSALVQKQYIYGDDSYVYVENGRVISFQNTQ